MLEEHKSKRELLQQLDALRNRVAQLEQADRKRLEREIALLARLPDENPNPVLRISEDCIILYANRASSPVLETWRIQVGQSLPEACCKRVKEALSSGQVSTFELNCDDGRIFLITLAPVVDGVYLNTYGVDITKIKEAEQAIRQSEERYRSIIEDSPILLCNFLPDGEITFVNTAYCEYFGKTSDELVGSKFTPLIPDEDGQAVLDNILSLTVDSPLMTHEHKVTASDGQVHWHRWTNRALFDKQGRAVSFQSFGEDITEHRRVEKRLRESEEQFRVIFEGAAEGILLINVKNGKIVDFNQATCENLGYTREEFQKLAIADLEVVESPEEIAKHIQKIIKNHGDIFETKHRTKDGLIRETLVSSRAISIREGEHLVSIWNDVTDIKQAERQIRTLSSAVEQSIDGITIGDLEGNLTYANNSFLKMWGYEDENEVLGRNGVEFCQLQGEASKIIETLRDRGSWMGELTAVRKDGSAFDVQSRASAVRDQNGRPMCLMGSFVDVSESKQKEAELSLYRERMARAERFASLGTVGATVAHELTQPLTVIRLSIENSLADLDTTPCPEAVTEGLKDGLLGVSNAISIIDRLRNFAKKSTAGDIDQVDLKAAAERVKQLLDEQAWRAKVTVRLKNMEKLPAIFMNKRDLEQLLFVLVQNAIQAADGEEDRQLTISALVKGKYVEVRFSDNCGGIAPENLDKIFEPFFTTKPPGKSTGLGLCIVQRIASDAGASVRVESQAGKGSTFFITLPIKKGRRVQPNGDDR